MTIDTQHLRDLIRRAVPLPWALATSNSWRRILSRDGAAVCSPCNQPDGHPDLHFPGGAEGPTITLLIEAANALPDLLDIIEALEGQVDEYARMLEKQSAEADARIDAQAAEIARLREALRPLAEIDLTEPPPNDFAWFVLRARAALTQEQGGSDGGQN